MRHEIHFDPKQQKRRWVAYFDLLGTRARIKSQNYLQVFVVYAQALEQLKLRNKDAPPISHACFSDTFLIYSETDSGEDFVYMDMVARWFAYNLIVAKIPVRGALACDDFYTDRNNSLYFGPALVEAYEYGEAQDWLGFLLAPSAVSQLEKLGIPAGERLNYAYAKLPFKTGKGLNLTKELPACILGQWATFNGRNQCVDALEEMKAAAGSNALKYSNTIEFIEKNRRLPAKPVNEQAGRGQG